MTSKSMSQLRNEVQRLGLMFQQVQRKSERAHAMAARWAAKARVLDAKAHELSERAAGIRGHLEYEALGAVEMRVVKTTMGWAYCEFYDAMGRRVRSPEEIAAQKILDTGAFT